MYFYIYILYNSVLFTVELLGLENTRLREIMKAQIKKKKKKFKIKMALVSNASTGKYHRFFFFFFVKEAKRAIEKDCLFLSRPEQTVITV
jgi:hypothetical protein